MVLQPKFTQMNHLSTSSPHQHGGNIDLALTHHGLTAKQPVIDFSVNVNPLGPPEIIIQKWPEWVKHVGAYPSQNGGRLKKFYCRRFDLPADCVLTGNGSIELIYLAPRALKIKTALIFVPSFHDYLRACDCAGVKVVKKSLMRGRAVAGYPREKELQALIGRVDAVFLGNPNNPCGSLMKGEAIRHLAEQFPRTWFLIDEAFSQFLDTPDRFSLMYREKLTSNILVFHSLTKFYALPGLRMGAVIGHPETIARLAGYKEPWTVNALAEAAADLLAGCEEYEADTRELISRERGFLQRSLSTLRHIRMVNSPANYIFARLDDAVDPDAFMRGLLARGIYLRDCRNFESLDGNYFRAAVRCRDDNCCLVAALTEICGRQNA